jgi:hypothetical protein
MHLETARRQGLGERLQRHMRRLFDLPQNKKPVLTADGERAMTAHASRCDAAKTALAGGPFDDARYRTFSAAATTRLLSPAASRAIAQSRKSIE